MQSAKLTVWQFFDSGFIKIMIFCLFLTDFFKSNKSWFFLFIYIEYKFILIKR